MKLHLLLAGAVLVGTGAGTLRAVSAPRGLQEGSGQRGQRTDPAKPVLALKTYPVPGGDAQDVAQVLQGIYNRNPGVTVTAVGPNTILALAPTQDQAEIARTVQTLSPAPVTEVIPLSTLKAVRVVDTLRVMLGMKGLFLEADAEHNAVIVRGSREQIAEVRTTLRLLGEGAERAGNPRVITLEIGSASALAEALAEYLQRMRPNPVQVTLPGQPGGTLPKPAPGNHPPVSLTAVGNRLIVACEDPQILALVNDLVPLLTAPRAGEGDYEVIRLRSASAVDVAKVLDELFNGSPAGPATGRVRTERIRVVADPASNSLLVRAAPLDQVVIRRLIRAPLDTVEPAEAPTRRIQVIGLKHARAPELAKVIREVYRDAERTLAITADVRTNSLVVRCPPALEQEIRALVQELDQPGPAK